MLKRNRISELLNITFCIFQVKLEKSNINAVKKNGYIDMLFNIILAILNSCWIVIMNCLFRLPHSIYINSHDDIWLMFN